MKRSPARLFALAMILLAGCDTDRQLGHAFLPPSAATSLVVGRSTEADIVAIYGPPTRRTGTGTLAAADPAQAVTFHNSTDTTLMFQNGSRVVVIYPVPGTDRRRRATFRLHDGLLTGYSFDGQFTEDVHAFETDAVAVSLKRPNLTQADLEAMIGPPRSRQTYPLTTPNQTVAEREVWAGILRHPAGQAVGTQSLTVTFGRDGKITDHTLNLNNAQPQ